MPTYSETIRRRLLALVLARGFALSALSEKMGYNHAHLTRKLDPSDGSGDRKLTTQDVDEILAALDEPHVVLEDHVLTDPDRMLLGWLASAATPPSEKEARRFLKSATRILRRLLLQELVEPVSPGDTPGFRPTAEGLRVYAELATREAAKATLRVEPDATALA